MIPYLLFWLLVAVPSAWKDWHYAREISVKSPGLTVFALPPSVYDHAGSAMADVRMIDGAGNEVPFALQRRPAHADLVWHLCKMMADNSKDGISDVTLDTGDDNALHNSLQMEISDPDFLARVDIEVSDVPDKDWRTVRTGVPIYRYRPDGLEGNQTVQFPDNYARYIRVIITPGKAEGTLDAMAAQHVTPLHLIHFQTTNDDVKKPDWVNYTPIFTPDTSASDLQSWWKSDALTDTIPVTGIRITTMNKDFHRPVRISTSRDGKTWVPVFSGDIYRTGGDRPSERLDIEFPETSVRYWRIAFFDNGFPPLTISKIELLGAPHYVVFQAHQNTVYRMLYGNGRVVAGDYEMSRLVDLTAYKTAQQATVGEEEPLTIKRSNLFKYGVVGGGIVLLAAIALIVTLLLENSRDHEPA